MLGTKNYISYTSSDISFDEVYVCLDELQNGKVVWIFNEPGYPVELLNNTVPQLAEMLLLIKEDQKWRERWHEVPEEEKPLRYEQHWKEIIEQMRNVDPDALNGNKGWSEMIYRLQG